MPLTAVHSFVLIKPYHHIVFVNSLIWAIHCKEKVIVWQPSYTVFDGRHTHRQAIAVRTADGRRTITNTPASHIHYHFMCAANHH